MKKSDRQKVFDKYCGHCAYCGCELTKGWHVDHIEALHRDHRYDRESKKWVFTGVCANPENDHADNYNPSCASCNITKSGMSMQDFRELIQQTVETLNSNQYRAYRFAKRYGLIQETGKEVTFYFELFNNNQQ